MATMTIRGLDDSIKARLRVQAAMHGRSMEDEARDILCIALSQEQAVAPCLVTSIRAKIEAVGGVDLALPKREPIRDVVDFS